MSSDAEFIELPLYSSPMKRGVCRPARHAQDMEQCAAKSGGCQEITCSHSSVT
jgi:hypothetical protein